MFLLFHSRITVVYVCTNTLDSKASGTPENCKPILTRKLLKLTHMLPVEFSIHAPLGINSSTCDLFIGHINMNYGRFVPWTFRTDGHPDVHALIRLLKLHVTIIHTSYLIVRAWEHSNLINKLNK